MASDGPVYTVRLSSVTPAMAKKGRLLEAGSIPHTHAVSREMLRPGWTWRGGKWIGRWVPKVKSKYREKREAAYEQVSKRQQHASSPSTFEFFHFSLFASISWHTTLRAR